jgi:hypothetical protein
MVSIDPLEGNAGTPRQDADNPRVAPVFSGHLALTVPPGSLN